MLQLKLTDGAPLCVAFSILSSLFDTYSAKIGATMLHSRCGCSLPHFFKLLNPFFHIYFLSGLTH